MYFKGTLYLNALDEISHRKIVVEENADQHLHHFTIELKWEMGRQDQLETTYTKGFTSCDSCKSTNRLVFI